MARRRVAYDESLEQFFCYCAPVWEPIVLGSGDGVAWGNISGTLSAQTDLASALANKAAAAHNHTGVYQPAGSYAAAAHSHAEGDVTGLTAALAGKAASGHNHAGVYDPAGSAAAALAASAPVSHSHAEGDVTGLTAALAGKAAVGHNHDASYAAVAHNQAASTISDSTATGRAVLTAADAAAARSAIGAVGSIASASAFAAAETTISTAAYADIAGCSVSLTAGTWLVIGQVTARAANAIVQAFVALTHNDNTVISEVAASRPASGTASLNSPFSVAVHGIVSPVSTTTYKLRGARGLTTHTGSWIAMDGNGVNTANHASNNTDKGSGIFAIKLA